MKKTPDDNDRLVAGTLSSDPREGTTKVTPTRPDAALDTLPFLTTEHLPCFPLEALPKAVRTFVTGLAESLEVPVDLPAVLSLGVLASAVQGKYEVHPKADWTETVNLYLVVAFDSGERKSPVFKRVLRPLFRYQSERVQAWKNHVEQLAAEAQAKGEKPGKNNPARPRLFLDDATPEAAARVLAEQNERITIASDEGTLFQHMLGMYSKTPNNGLWLKAHDGGRYTVDRRSGPPVFLDNPLATLALAVQPSVIRSLADKPELRGQGMWARFAYAFPRSRVGTRTYDTAKVDPLSEDTYRELVLEMARREFPPPGQDPIAIKFSGPAWTKLRETLLVLEQQMISGEPLEAIRDWASKLAGLLVRLAGLLHAADYEHPGQVTVSEETVERALALGHYFLEHARHAFEVEMTSAPTEDRAHKAWNIIIRKNWTEVTTRQLRKSIRGLTKADAEGVIESLVARGYIVPARGRREGVYLVVNYGIEQSKPLPN